MMHEAAVLPAGPPVITDMPNRTWGGGAVNDIQAYAYANIIGTLKSHCTNNSHCNVTSKAKWNSMA